jgi:murein DD-endopeptidase MepM/ murein hydrolase activator NlpD
LSAVTDNGRIVLCSGGDALKQGGIMRISLKSPPFSRAKIFFGERDFTFVPSSDGLGFFALIGSGLDTKPGTYDVTTRIEFAEGGQDNFTTRIVVSGEDFPVRKIKVDSKFTLISPEDKKRIQEEAKLVDDVCFASAASGWLGMGNFIVPVEGKIARNFGDRRIFNDNFSSHHKGVDIPSIRGKPVRASNSGEAVLVRDLFFGGNTVIINHGAGLFSVYCHLSEAFVREGDIVDKGNIIGSVGSTGRATGPHMHWGFRLIDRPVNPLFVLDMPFN